MHWYPPHPLASWSPDMFVSHHVVLPFPGHPVTTHGTAPQLQGVSGVILALSPILLIPLSDSQKWLASTCEPLTTRSQHQELRKFTQVSSIDRFLPFSSTTTTRCPYGYDGHVALRPESTRGSQPKRSHRIYRCPCKGCKGSKGQK